MKNITLWVVQVVLAAVFLFAGGVKLVMPIEMLTAQLPLPEVFVRFLGVCEVAGALGLVLAAVGLLAGAVAYGRARVAPLPTAARGRTALQVA